MSTNRPDAAVIEMLSDDEAALFAILMDPSGLDQAEFLWFDPSVEDDQVCVVCGSSSTSVHAWDHPDPPPDEDGNDATWVRSPDLSPTGCFRAWAYQWSWWRSIEARQIDQCARSLGKSLSIKVRGCCFPFVHPGAEMVVTAPELVHLEPIVGLIEQQMYSTRLYREMLMKGRSGVTHRPFQMNFQNGARIIGRIPQRDGRGVKGLHPIWLEMDEAQDYPHDGWVELRETLKRGHDDCRWRAHGVTRGVKDDFYEHTQEDDPENAWTVHRYTAMARPTWSDVEREEKIKEYGSRDDPDYRRNVLGKHGDSTNPIFVVTQLMKNVDNDNLSEYNVDEYYKRVIKIEMLNQLETDMIGYLDFPRGHLSYAGDAQERLANDKRKAIYWVGMDVGFTTDPSEILVWVEYKEKPRDTHNKIKLLTRLSLVRMPHEEQIKAMISIIAFYRPKAFALDRNGNGLSLYQELQRYVECLRNKDYDNVPPWVVQYEEEVVNSLVTIKGYSFGEKLIVELDDTIDLDMFDDPATKAGLRKNCKDHATDVLREMVDRVQLWMPWDDEFLKQFQGGRYENVKGGMDSYGRRQYTKGNDHCLDAARFMALAWSLDAIELLLAKAAPPPIYDSFISL